MLAAVGQADTRLSLSDLRSMESRIADSLVGRRSPAVLGGTFAGVALLLATVGTYGMLSYAVAQREREIGVRMALGAQPEQIRQQFLGLGLRLLGAGTVLGVGGAWLAGRAMQGILFGVSALHWPTVAATAVVLGAISLGACLIPARRAARVDPLVALRAE